jgi:hypothetical protein
MAAADGPSSHNSRANSILAASYSGTATLVRTAKIKEYDAEIITTNEKQIYFPVRVL